MTENQTVTQHSGDIVYNTLDKLAQLRKIQDEKLKKRAKSKFITFTFLDDLIKLDSDLRKSYINTKYCVSQLQYDPEKLILWGKYCNNRWCLVCNRIRTGKLMNSYYKQLSESYTKQFITLTIPNVNGMILRETIKNMIKIFQTILDNLRKYKLSTPGIRKLECTYNRIENTYHPHFHIITTNQDTADYIYSQWMIKNKSANIKAQKIKQADNDSLKELFKYFTKIVTKQKKTHKHTYNINIKALDTINSAFYGLRVFQTFGGLKIISEDITEIIGEELKIQYDSTLWNWVQDVSNWISTEGETLTENNYHETIKVFTE